MDIVSEPFDLSKIESFLREVHGRVCWRAYVSFGNSPAFFFGKKVRRDGADAMMRHPRWKDRSESWYTAEIVFIVWCSWRLDFVDGTITSSDDSRATADAGIERIAGRSLVSSIVTPPAGDLELEFSGDLKLKVFCDHVPGEPSFDGNWELQVRRSSLVVGPGSSCSYTDCETDAIDEREDFT